VNPADKDTIVRAYGVGFAKSDNMRLPPEIPKEMAYILKIALGDDHALFLTGNQRLLVCGSNQFGQLGLLKSQNEGMIENPTFNEIKLQSLYPLNILDVACGSNHSIVLGESNGTTRIAVFGNEAGLGFGDLQNLDTPAIQTLPDNVTDVSKVFASFNRSIVVTQSGKVFQWGEDFFGGRIEKPTFTKDFGCGITSFAVGYLHALALTEKAEVYSWGEGSYGELGHNDTEKRKDPTLIEFFAQNKIVLKQVSAGSRFSLALDSAGSVYAFGCNSMKECGKIGDRCLVPSKIDIISGDQAIFIGAGYSHCACITTKAEVYTWGDCTSGKLGHSINESSALPKKIDELEGNEITALAIGKTSTLLTTGPFEKAIRTKSIASVKH
jgi:alpha-tubulin suppressor-like RCC1 family protein